MQHPNSIELQPGPGNTFSLSSKTEDKELKPNVAKLCRDYLYAKAYDQASSVTTSEHTQAQCLLQEEQQWVAAQHVRGVLGCRMVVLIGLRWKLDQRLRELTQS